MKTAASSVAHGVTELLHPAAWGHSPALGTVASRWTASHQLLYAGSVTASTWRNAGGNSCATALSQGNLARLLFHCVDVGAPLKPCRNRSKPAAWLLGDPVLLGKVIGLACTQESIEWRRGLRAAGIATNQVRGERSGISLARWEALLAALREAGTHAAGGKARITAPPIAALQFLCLTTREACGGSLSSSCAREQLLQYLAAVHSETPILNEGVSALLNDGGWRKAWVQTPAPPVDEVAAQAASARLLHRLATPQHKYHDHRQDQLLLRDWETVAASLAQHDVPSGPPLYVEAKRRFRNASPIKADCVEHAIRSLIDSVPSSEE